MINNQNSITYKQAKEELLAELDAWDEYDAGREPLPEELADLDDNEGFGPSGSIHRARALIPLILDRFEEDIKGKLYPSDLAARMFDATTKILSIKRKWFSERNNLDPDIYPSAPEKTVMDASNSFRSALKKWTVPDIRFRNDMKRLFLDLWIIGSWLLDFADNARRHGEWPPDEPGQWNTKEWCAYFWRNICRRSPLISYMEKHGLSQESLDKGFANEEIFSRRSNQRAKDFVRRYELERQLTAAWNPAHPEIYLDAPELPPPPPDDDSGLFLETVDLSEELNEQSAWSVSLPELRRWNNNSDKRPLQPYQKDPAFKELNKFASRFFRASKENWKHQQMESEYPPDYRPPLDQYLALLLLCAEGVMIHALMGDDDESEKPDANRLKGCHLFCAEVFSKFAKAIEVCNNQAYHQLGAEARKLTDKITNI